MEKVRGSALRVGDVLAPWGERTATITALRPYRGPLASIFSAGAQLADLRPGDFGATGITIENDCWYDVVR